MVKRNTSGVVISTETQSAIKETAVEKKQDHIPEKKPVESQQAQTESSQLSETEAPEQTTESAAVPAGPIGPGIP